MSKQWETWDEEKIKTFQETFLTWSLLETVISVSGLVFILILSIFV